MDRLGKLWLEISLSLSLVVLEKCWLVLGEQRGSGLGRG